MGCVLLKDTKILNLCSVASFITERKKKKRKEDSTESPFIFLNSFSPQTAKNGEPVKRLAFRPDGEMLVCFNNSDQCFLVKVLSNDETPGTVQMEPITIKGFDFSTFYSAAWYG